MRFICLMLLALMWAAPCRAGVQVVADGGGARRVEPKGLELKVQIAGGFAATTAQWTFSNAQVRPFEAEFIAEAPADAVVTGFAYWFKGRKVVARIVEKARAARIYRGVVQQRRDPALVEMLARNFFRARISPVEAGRDLRVEVTWVQPLHWQNKALIYHCPLWREGENLNLENWRVAAQIQAAAGVSQIETNFGAAVEGRNPAFALSASGQKTPPQTLQIRLPVAGAPAAGTPLPILATTSMSGGTPYFAILSPDALPNSWLMGAKDVFSGRLNGGGFLSVGRGSLPANTVRLNVPGGGEKLWAAQKIDNLGQNEKNRAATMKLSMRYGLPSKWTSWLAIPDEERVRLKEIIEAEKRAQARRNIEQLGRQMALEVAAGRQSSRGYALMKSQFIENCRILELPAEKTLQGHFSSTLADISAALGYRGNYYVADAEKNLAKARSLYLQVMRLGRRVPVAERPGWSQQAEAKAAQSLGGALAAVNTQKLEKAILAGRTNAGLRAALEAGAPASLGPAARLTGLKVATERLAQIWAEQKAKPKPNASVVKALRAQVEKLVAKQRVLAPKDEKPQLKNVLSQAEDRAFGGRISNLRNELDKETIAHRENGARAQELRGELRAIATRLSAPSYALNSESGTMQQYIAKTVGQLRGEQSQFRPDAQKIAALQAELKRIEPFLTPDQFQNNVNSGEQRWRSEAPRGLAVRWGEARYGGTPDPQAAEFYAAQIQKLLDVDYEANRKNSPSFPFTRELASRYLRDVEATWLGGQSSHLMQKSIGEESALRPDEAKIAALKAQLDALQANTLYNQNRNDQWLEASRSAVFESVLEHLRQQRRRPDADPALIADLEQRVIALQPFDRYYGQGSWSGGRKPNDPKEFGKLRVQRIKARTQREKAVAQLQQSPADTALRMRVAELARRENELTVRMGDPLIAVVAPADCRQIIAVLPSGEIKSLLFNPQNNQWEARFDVPIYASEGAYTITIVVVAKSGARQRLKMSFRVDMTAPQGAGSVAVHGGDWLLSLQTGAETDRVEALLPWGERADLKRENGVFLGRAAVPHSWRHAAVKVVYVLTDRAHNRTRIEVDMAP